jgi:hypothetical protein
MPLIVRKRSAAIPRHSASIGKIFEKEATFCCPPQSTDDIQEIFEQSLLKFCEAKSQEFGLALIKYL